MSKRRHLPHPQSWRPSIPAKPKCTSLSLVLLHLFAVFCFVGVSVPLFSWSKIFRLPERKFSFLKIRFSFFLLFALFFFSFSSFWITQSDENFLFFCLFFFLFFWRKDWEVVAVYLFPVYSKLYFHFSRIHILIGFAFCFDSAVWVPILNRSPFYLFKFYLAAQLLN